MRLGVCGLLFFATTQFTLPATAAPKLNASTCTPKYVVASGDTLGGIAIATGHTVNELRRANRLKTSRIYVEQRLKLPRCRNAARSRPSGGERLFRVPHRVRRGESIGRIAKLYGVTPRTLRKANKLRRDVIRVGAKLTVPVRMGTKRSTLVTYTIRPGDTLSSIAERFRVTWQDIRKLNGNIAVKRLYIGSKIKVLVEGPVPHSKALGRPYRGRLVNGEQLPRGPGYYRRRPRRAWGTSETISHILHAIQTVRRRFRRIHDLAIGDLSKRRGGQLSPHVSHQSGRDADLGFYFKGQPRKGPKRFLSGLSPRLDLRATWALMTALIGESRKRSPVRVIFLSYRIQERLYRWAKKQGVSERRLNWLFQYPHGNRALRGVIRHASGHWAHMHVRFKCPVASKGCSG